MENQDKTDLIQLVDRTYREFEQDFTDENFPAVFNWIKQFNQSGCFGKGGHALSLSAPPIFQTPVHNRPKLMLVGNNNSWFDSKERRTAEENLNQLAGRTPTVNSYMDYDTTFGRSLRKVFGRDKGQFLGLNKLEVLRDCVGINRLWIQIGADDKPKGATRGMKSVSEDVSPAFSESFRIYCESRTRDLIKTIEPKILVLIGDKAKALYQYAEEPKGVHVVHSRHPAYGGEQEMADSIRPFL
jgi:hypothetical protein